MVLLLPLLLQPSSIADGRALEEETVARLRPPATHINNNGSLCAFSAEVDGNNDNDAPLVPSLSLHMVA